MNWRHLLLVSSLSVRRCLSRFGHDIVGLASSLDAALKLAGEENF
jgi:hypothetical protein